MVRSQGGVVESKGGSLTCELPTDAPQEAQDALAALKEQECDVVALLEAYDLLKRVRFRMPMLDDLSVVVAIPGQMKMKMMKMKMGTASITVDRSSPRLP